ncbi:MAG: MerR family transcriptional regulator [Chloroflexia bacterium]
MTIAELAEEAEVTPRTIRYYVEQGLLPPPGRGRVAEYTEEHLQLLGLIARLKRHYLPLEEIRDMLQRLSRKEIEELLTNDEPVTGDAQERSSAADYIANLFERGHSREQAKLREAPMMADYSMASPSAPLAAPAAAPAPPPPMASRAFYASAPLLAKSESAVAQEAPHPEESAWHRVTVAPGVELHFHASSGARVRSVMSRLIAAVDDILETSPEKETKEK